MRRLFLAITKGEALRFLGHLDVIRTFERIVQRSGLIATFSEGFNPHMKIAFDAALGVGVAADPLYAELRIESEETTAEISEKLSAECPEGLTICGIIEAEPDWPKLINFLNEDSYEVEGPVSFVQEETETARRLAAFNALPSYLYERVTPKKTRTMDVKQMLSGPVEAEIRGDRAFLRFSLWRINTGSIQPKDLWKILADDFGMPWTPGELVCKRIGTYHREGERRITPFDADAFPKKKAPAPKKKKFGGNKEKK